MNSIEPGQLWRFSSPSHSWALFVVIENYDYGTLALTLACSPSWRLSGSEMAKQTVPGKMRRWSLAHDRQLVTDMYSYELIS